MSDQNNAGISVERFAQGYLLKSSDADFLEGIQAVVDYRGDVTVSLKDGSCLTGYVYNANSKSLDMFPRDSSRKETVHFADLLQIEFSGEDAAKGKSWEEWVKRRDQQASRSANNSSDQSAIQTA